MSTTAPHDASEGAVGMPWVDYTRRSPLRTIAEPSLVGALRRLFAIDGDPHTLVMLDLEALDKGCPATKRATKGRVTKNRLRKAQSWDRMHPQGPRPFMHNLRDAGYILLAVGLVPSQVHWVKRTFAVPANADDQTLLRCAHLSAVNTLNNAYTAELVRSHGWSVDDLLAWSAHYDAEHFDECVDAGYGKTELRNMLRAGEVPDASQVGMFLGFGRARAAASA